MDCLWKSLCITGIVPTQTIAISVNRTQQSNYKLPWIISYIPMLTIDLKLICYIQAQIMFISCQGSDQAAFQAEILVFKQNEAICQICESKHLL